MSLNEDLARLGLQPIEAAENDEDVSADDAIREIMHVAFWQHDKFGAEEAFDAARQLELEAARLRRALAKCGVGAVTTEDFVPEPMTRSTRPKDCDHPKVRVGLEDNLLRCDDCDKNVNPIWWLTRHASALRKSEDWLTHLKKERRTLHAEIETLKKERSKHKAAVRRKDGKRP